MRMQTHINEHPTVIARFALASLLLISAASLASAQQRRPAQSRPKPPATTPAPTFDTLLATDSYKIYGEVRGVGQLIRSNSVNELLEPVMKIAAPPKEFGTLVKWLNKHADAVMTSRMMVAFWPTAKDVPSVLVAIEFANAEEAERFEPQLNDFLPRVLPTPSPNPSPSPEGEGNVATAEKPKPTPPQPSYYLSRSGSLIFITSTKLNLKSLRPPGTKLLNEDANFRTARDRFGSEQVFAFVDFNGIEKEEEETAKRLEEERKKQKNSQADDLSEQAVPNASTEASPESASDGFTVTEIKKGQVGSPESPQQSTPNLLSIGFDAFLSSGTAKWPEGLGIGISLDNESLDARVLLVNNPGQKSDAIPLFPFIIPGQPISPEGASILPVDTELLVTASLDWAQMYSRLTRPDGPMLVTASNPSDQAAPFADLENKLGIKIKEDLLPLLGSEVAVALPVNMSTSTETTDNTKPKPDPKPTELQPIIAIAVRDKAAVKVLLPKIIDALGFKGASSLAQVEKRGDTEIISFANAVAYAFIGNFLVLSPDVANVRHVVESYLKGETLNGDANFKNYTRWQPRQLQGQIYLSPAVMESYKTWAQEPTALISDQTREFLTRLAFISQPVTYALSNDGLGSLHEIHVPKNLLLMLVASISGETNPPPMLANERAALGAVHMIAAAELEYKTSKGNGSFGTLEQLIAEKDFLKQLIQNSNYKIEVTVAGNHFEVSAVPTEYGKTGRMSYFSDETQVIRGGDLAGAPATVASKPISQ